MKKNDETLGDSLRDRVEKIAREVLEEYLEKKSELSEEEFDKYWKNKLKNYD